MSTWYVGHNIVQESIKNLLNNFTTKLPNLDTLRPKINES